MARIKTFIKDPDSTEDYDVDFTAWLNGVSDTIDYVAWIVPAGITNAGVSNTTLIAKIYLSGGTVGQRYRIVCRITTVGTTVPRVKDKSFYIKMKEK